MLSSTFIICRNQQKSTMSFDNLLFYFHYNLLFYLTSFIRLFCYKLIFYLNIPAARVRIEAFDNMVITKLFNTEKGGYYELHI